MQDAIEIPPAAKDYNPKRYIFAALSASLIGVGLVRFAYTPLLPALIQARWFPASAAVYLSAASLAGYLLGALTRRPISARISNVGTLRAMKVLAVLSLLACAFPVSESWFFLWRLLAGFSGGATVVLVAATVLPHIPAHHRGLATGAIFLGIGLGIVASGTIVPLLLRFGLRATWLGLAGFSAFLTAASWNAWPRASSEIHRPSKPVVADPHQTIGIMYFEFALMALAPVATMLFLADFVARDLGRGVHLASVDWVLYGFGAIAGPPVYGFAIDRWGTLRTVRWVFFVQSGSLLWLSGSSDLVSVAVISFVLGSFVSGVIPLVLAWLREVIPDDTDRQNHVWSRATSVFAASQAIGGYAYSGILDANGGFYRELFLISAGAIGLALTINLLMRRERGPKGSP